MNITLQKQMGNIWGQNTYNSDNPLPELEWLRYCCGQTTLNILQLIKQQVTVISTTVELPKFWLVTMTFGDS